jgi:rare lipoprotein A
VVRINDRGPFVANRIVDLSYSAAARLDVVRTGTAFVELRTVGASAADSELESAPAPEPAPAPISTPIPAPTVTPAPTPPSAPVALYIQVGAFAEQNNAQRLVELLQAHGLTHVFSLATTSGGRPLRRVRVGPIATVEEFDQLAARLAALGYPEARLATD